MVASGITIVLFVEILPLSLYFAADGNVRLRFLWLFDRVLHPAARAQSITISLTLSWRVVLSPPHGQFDRWCPYRSLWLSLQLQMHFPPVYAGSCSELARNFRAILNKWLGKCRGVSVPRANLGPVDSQLDANLPPAERNLAFCIFRDFLLARCLVSSICRSMIDRMVICWRL